jgi:carbamoyl-phosphate synthase large subunit
MNILLSSVGRRSYLVEYFRDALKGQGQVVATNTIGQTTGMFAADLAEVVPAARDPSFVETMLRLCRRHNIRLVLSLHDWEAPFLAPYKKDFLAIGTQLVIADPDVVARCLDKYETHRLALELGISSPATFVDMALAKEALGTGRMAFPVILKPRWGQGSLDQMKVSDAEELKLAFALTQHRLNSRQKEYSSDTNPDRQIVIQEFLHGTEYGVDIVNDLQGRFAACFVKRKLAMRNGETDAAETVSFPALEHCAKAIASHIRHPGNLDADFFVTPANEIVLLELNPRFGGGYPFSHMAGANVPAALVAWASGKAPAPDWLKIKVGLTFYKDIRMVQGTAEPSASAPGGHQ